ncbi:hypothetical protein LXA54_16930 [Erwinia amylovora]|uniref:hypothetical protein n=1 Tax=Erwinia amylovora TaxID=552 RepID=UPI0020BF6414|nr:hypothetical protein [Erwinia amylovora]MCK8335974.1 hypothetical protein [Erwinia amylovora]
MNSENHITFYSYEPTSFKRKNIAILRSIFAEIESYLDSGCTREDIYQSLISEPYNLDMTKGSFINAIHRIRAELSKNPENQLSSRRSVNVNPRSEAGTTPNAGNRPLLKGAKIFQTLSQDAKKYERNPNPDLDELLKGNKDD